MEKFNGLDWVALILTIIGGFNWGLVGINQKWNFVELLLGTFPSLERIIYILIGLATLWVIYAVARINTSGL